MTFTAQWKGECVACDSPIEPGQVIKQISAGEYSHVICTKRTGQKRCDKCYQEFSVTGNCACPDNL